MVEREFIQVWKRIKYLLGMIMSKGKSFFKELNTFFFKFHSQFYSKRGEEKIHTLSTSKLHVSIPNKMLPHHHHRE